MRKVPPGLQVKRLEYRAGSGPREKAFAEAWAKENATMQGATVMAHLTRIPCKH